MATHMAFKLDLFGPLRLTNPEGQRIEISSKRGMALVALLAMAPGGERTRVWLQDVLWGSRGQLQAQSSLRRELANLRKSLNSSGAAVIGADHHKIWIALDQVTIDARMPDVRPSEFNSVFLEGLDIAGEEGFEDWLRGQRQLLLGQDEDEVGHRAQGYPPTIVDLSSPVPGFSGRPALAILPLHNETGDSQLDYLAEGISEELIERLSRLKWLPVIARSASFAWRNTAVPLQQIGAALGARYVLEGFVRQTEQGFRLAFEMADVETGYAVLSQKADIPIQFNAEIVRELMLEIVSALDMRIDVAEKTRASRKANSILTVDDLIWRARWHLHRFTRDDSAIAEKLLREALTLAPNSSEALVQMTYAQIMAIWTQRKPDNDTRELRKFAQRAIAADWEDGRAYMYAGMAEMWMRKPTVALPLLEKAVELNPSLAFAYVQIGCLHALSGDAEAAIGPLKMAIRLAPNDEQSFVALNELAVGQSMLENWDEAIALAEQSLNRRVAYWYAHVVKINALARRGRLEDARLAVADLRIAKPNFSIKMVDWVPFVDRKWNEFFREGFYMAEAQ